MSTLCRLEYLTPDGWVVGHAGIALLAPERYPERLFERGKYGRVTVLDDRLQPTGTVYNPPSLPDPKDLRPSGTHIPHVPPPVKKPPVDLCDHCDEFHAAPFDGGCLI